MNALNGSIVIAMAALVMIIAPAAAADESSNFTVDDISNFFHAMQKTDFGDIEISGNNITFYSPEGSVKCKGEYDYVIQDHRLSGISGRVAYVQFAIGQRRLLGIQTRDSDRGSR